MMKCKGSVTVFCALSLMLIASFLFALLEAGRVSMLDAYADMTSELALESVCAEYQPTLWDTYHLLCLDGAYGGEMFSMEYADNVLRQRIDRNISTNGLRGSLFAMRLAAVEPIEYQLLTDGEGKVFLHQIAAYTKENFLKETAESLYEKYTSDVDIDAEAPMEDSIENAQKALATARENQKKEMDSSDAGNVSDGTEKSDDTEVSGKAEGAGAPEVAEEKENPLEIALALKENAILGMVAEHVDTLSTKRINPAESLLNRKCQRGKGAVKTAQEWEDKVLALEYLNRYYGDFIHPAAGHALSYETEYVLCGQDADKSNLEGTVNRLMRLREKANVVHIVQDSEKREEASLLANGLAGFTGNPAIIKAVQIGIIGAWAYMESILDVRALLQGDKIAWLKTKEEWTLQVTNLLESFQGTAKAKNCAEGLSYQAYLKFMLFRQSEKLLAYRMMDVMEQNMRLVPAQSHCRMDHMICRMAYRMEYEAGTVFLKSHVLKNVKIKQFSYE